MYLWVSNLASLLTRDRYGNGNVRVGYIIVLDWEVIEMIYHGVGLLHCLFFGGGQCESLRPEDRQKVKTPTSFFVFSIYAE